MKQIPDSAEKNDDKLYFFFREKSLDSGAGASPSVLARVGRVCLVSLRTRNCRCTGSSSQFSQSIKKLFLFIHRMMRADRSHLWTNGRLFWRPGWCALWWAMMGWKPSLMNWVSVVFFPSWFHSSFVSNLPSISDIANTVVFPVMHT